jgi:hypothetical protein
VNDLNRQGDEFDKYKSSMKKRTKGEEAFSKVLKDLVVPSFEWVNPGGRIAKKPYKGKNIHARHRVISTYFRP